MRYFILPIFLGMAVLCHAQKWPKNELSVGCSAGDFFDSTAFKISTIPKGRNLAFTYTRNISPKLSSSIMYASYFFAYVDPTIRLKDNTVENRFIRRISLSGVYNLPAGWFRFRVKAGLNYCWGYKMNHYYYFGSGAWQEPVSEGVSYNKMGVVTGLGLEHKIVWGLFGVINVDYVRMFKGIDPNQLYLSYALGYRF